MYTKVLDNMEEQGGTLLDIRNKFEHDIGHFNQVILINLKTSLLVGELYMVQ